MEPERLANATNVSSSSSGSIDTFPTIESLDAVSVKSLMSLHRLCSGHAEKLMAALTKKSLAGRQGTRLAKVWSGKKI